MNNKNELANFQTKHLTIVCIIWYYFMISKISPRSNISEVAKEREILEYTIFQDIKFDIGKITKETIWANRGGCNNLGYPFLIFQLCERAGVEFTWHEEQLQPLKPIHVKKQDWSIEAKVEGIYESRNKSDDDIDQNVGQG